LNILTLRNLIVYDVLRLQAEFVEFDSPNGQTLPTGLKELIKKDERPVLNRPYRIRTYDTLIKSHNYLGDLLILQKLMEITEGLGAC
jgi:hypothetical protein